MKTSVLAPNTTNHSLVGEFEWHDSKQMHIKASYDRLAINSRYLGMISLVASVADLKAMRAAIGSDCQAGMTFSGDVPTNLGRRTVTADGRSYQIYMHRLPYAMAHAVFIARRPGLLLNDSNAALWAELKDSRYSTPMLRSWLPYLRSQLEVEGKLIDCDCVGCNCRMLEAGTSDLDAIVEVGLRNGLIKIEEE